jgi:DNA replication protein DnaC
VRKTIGDGFLSVPVFCQCEGAVKEREDRERQWQEEEAQREEARRKESARRLLAESNLGERFKSRVFGTYKVTAKNRSAYEAARTFVADFSAEETKGRGMILTGPVGTGKTHLAAAIVNELVKTGRSCVYGNVTALLGRLRGSYNAEGDSESEIMQKFCNADLLVVDDIGKEKTTEWVQEKLYAIINHRYEHYKKIVITTNDQFKTLESKLGEAAVSRLVEMCDGYLVGGEDYRKRGLQ